jgi:hypothetical protein
MNAYTSAVTQDATIGTRGARIRCGSGMPLPRSGRQ